MNRKWRLLLLAAAVFAFWGCGAANTNTMYTIQYPEYPIPHEMEVAYARERYETTSQSRNPETAEYASHGWTQRVVDEAELAQLTERDPELSFSISKQILARINGRAPYYIDQDIKQGRPLKVPDNFTFYKNWSPLPKEIPEVVVVTESLQRLQEVFDNYHSNCALYAETYDFDKPRS